MLRRLGSTPSRLRIATALAVLAGLVLAIAGLGALAAKSGDLDRARAENGDQARLQIVRTKLVVADAAAGIDVLLGPDQPRLTPHDYAWALQPAVIGLAIAARQADDAFPLAVANLRLSEYAGQVDSARELALLGRPEAAGRLTAASSGLRTEVLPRLAAVQATGADRLRADADASATGTVIAVAAGAVAVLLLLGVQVWLARRTRRVVNVGLATGLIAVAVALVGASVVATRSDGEVDRVRSGPYRLTQALVDARMAAFDARAVESLGVVRGDVPGAEPAWQASMAQARAALGTSDRIAAGTGAAADVAQSRRLLDTYAAVHARLLAAAQGGDRAGTVAVAVSPTVDGSPGSFEDVDTTTAALTARQAEAADAGWRRAGSGLTLAAWTCLVAGLAAAVLALVGMGSRLREYR